MFARFFSKSFAALMMAFLFMVEAAPLKAQGFLSPAKTEVKEDENQESPRFMMKRFLDILNSGDTDKAFPYVEFPKGMGLEDRRILITDLIEVLNKRGNIDIALISNNPTGSASDSLDPNVEKIGSILFTGTNIPVLIRYSSDKSRKGWRFTSEFMEQIPEIAASLHASWFETKVPKQLVTSKLMGLKAWQWIGFVIVIGISFLASMLLALFLTFVLKRIVKRFKLIVPDNIFTSFMTPFRLFTGLLVFSVLIIFLDTDLVSRQYIAFFEAVAMTLSFGLFAYRVTGATLEMMRLSYERQGKHNATSMLGPIQKGVTILIVILVATRLMTNFGFDVTAIIAGLGVVGIAIALASQKTLENLFGGVSILMDQPVRIGDFGRFGTTMGTIEDIGLRSTRVRTLDRTLVSIPNAQFSDMILENFEKRDKFRWTTQLGVRMDATSDQMRLLLMQIKELFLAHPMVYKEPARVRFLGFGATQLNVEIFAYIRASDSDESLAIIEDLNLRVMDIIRDAGTDLAYPSQTLFLERSAGISAEKQESAKKKIEEIRASSGGFPQPHYPSSWAESRVDTLEFPDIADMKDS